VDRERRLRGLMDLTLGSLGPAGSGALGLGPACLKGPPTTGPACFLCSHGLGGLNILDPGLSEGLVVPDAGWADFNPLPGPAGGNLLRVALATFEFFDTSEGFIGSISDLKAEKSSKNPRAFSWAFLSAMISSLINSYLLF